MRQKIQDQLMVIDSLLKSPDFSLAIAKSQDTAYYKGIGEQVPPFLTPGHEDDIVIKSRKEEKIAASVAGFYALECGIGVLCQRTKEKPTIWLQRIITGKIDSAGILLLNRFANATWKAGQPFRGLDRITRPVFTGAGFLPDSEVEKDYNQVKAAATKLFSSLQDLEDGTMKTQMEAIKTLLHSYDYAVAMASVMDSSYDNNPQQGSRTFTAKDNADTLLKTVREEKIAANLAGFYALECCTNYLVTTRNILPSEIFQSIIDESISTEDRDLFSRFANATWKAGQPFKGPDKISRQTFTAFYFLPKAAIARDWVQIKAAAKKLLAEL